MEIVFKHIDELIPYENNPRINDEAVKFVAESIRQFGWKVPCVIDSNNVLVSGHTRHKAARKLGIKEIPCIIADDLTEEEIRAFRLADNKVGEIAQWDIDKLNMELDEISFDMADFGFLDVPDMEFEEEKEREDLGDNLSDEYNLIVSCDDETQLEELYNEMMERGFSCRLSTL